MHSCLSRDRGSCDLFLVETSLLLFGIDTVARAFVFESGLKKQATSCIVYRKVVMVYGLLLETQSQRPRRKKVSERDACLTHLSVQRPGSCIRVQRDTVMKSEQ